MAIYLGDQLLTPAGGGNGGQQTLAQQLGLKVVPFYFTHYNNSSIINFDTMRVRTLGTTHFQLEFHPYLLGVKRHSPIHTSFRITPQSHLTPSNARILINAPLHGKIRSIHFPYQLNYFDNLNVSSKIRIFKITKQGQISYIQDFTLLHIIGAMYGNSGNSFMLHLNLDNVISLNNNEYLGFEIHIESKNSSTQPNFHLQWSVPVRSTDSTNTILPYIVMEA